MSRLIPRTLTIKSEDKFFGFGDSRSSGSSLEVSFEIPEGLELCELTRDTFEIKRELDTRVLQMEFARGKLTKEEFLGLRDTLKKRYDGILSQLKEAE